MADDRSAERDLDRFWNDLIAGLPLAAGDSLDARDAEAIRLFREHAAAPQPQDSRDRVRERVGAEIDALERQVQRSRANGKGRWTTSGPADSALQQASRPRIESSRRSGTSPIARRWAVAGAAALLIALAVGYVAFWPDGSEKRATIPAVAAPASPEPSATATAIPGVTQQEILEITLPADAVTAGPASVSLSHLTLLPDEQATYRPRSGVQLDYVMSGELSLQVDGSAQVVRAGSSTWESVSAGTPVSLGAGDAVLFVDLGDIAFINSGTVPAEVLEYGLASDATGQVPFDGAGWIINDYAQVGGTFPLPSPGILLPGVPAVLRLSHLVLEPDTPIPDAPIDRFQLTVVVPDNGLGTPVIPNMSPSSDGRTRNLGPATIAVYSVTLEIPGAAGTPLAVDPNAACPFPVGTPRIPGACEARGPVEEGDAEKER